MSVSTNTIMSTGLSIELINFLSDKHTVVYVYIRFSLPDQDQQYAVEMSWDTPFVTKIVRQAISLIIIDPLHIRVNAANLEDKTRYLWAKNLNHVLR